jgi:small conductance mechanosensitive channel
MRKQLADAWTKMIEKLDGWLETVVSYLPNLLLAIIVFTVSFFISRYINKIVKKALTRSTMMPSVQNIVAKTVAITVILVGLFIALGIMNLNKVLTTMLAGAGVAGLAVGLALQGTLANTFSGIVLSFVKSIKIGDWIESNDYTGEIVDIDLRTTTLKQVDNNLVSIPNKMVLENPIKNYSVTSQSRVILHCGVGYGSDLDFVKELTEKTIAKNFNDVDGIDEVQFFFTEFGDSSINFETRFWINSTSGLEVKKAKSKAIIAIKKAFVENGIDIPFPIRTIDFSNRLDVVSS